MSEQDFECPTDCLDHLNSRNHVDNRARSAGRERTEWAAAVKARRRSSYEKSSEVPEKARKGHQCNGHTRRRGAMACYGDLLLNY